MEKDQSEPYLPEIVSSEDAPMPDPILASPRKEARRTTVTIQSKPSGANVFIDDKLWGTTPVTYTAPKSAQPLHVRVESLGYETSFRKVRLNRDRTETFRLSKTLLGP